MVEGRTGRGVAPVVTKGARGYGVSRAERALLVVGVLCAVIWVARTLPAWGLLFTLLGTLLGVVVGLFGDRWLHHRGDVHCQAEVKGGDNTAAYNTNTT